MVDVFISYKSDRRKAAAHLTRILECYGYTVWYDYSLIKGRDFAAQIDAKIRESKAVIVLWCSRSVRSEWVAAEAALAAKLDTLVPAKIEPCELRVDFRQKDYIDLTGWGGAARDHALDLLLTALEQKTGHAPQLNFKAMCEYEEVWRRFGAPSLKAFALDAAVRSDPESSEEAKAPGEARHDREASARQPKREWADDIQMPIPDRGPVSLVPDQAQPRAESDPPPSPRPFSPASLLPDESPVERTRKLIYKYFIGFFLALPLIALDLLGNETGLALFESRFGKKTLDYLKIEKIYHKYIFIAGFLLGIYFLISSLASLYAYSFGTKGAPDSTIVDEGMSAAAPAAQTAVPKPAKVRYGTDSSPDAPQKPAGETCDGLLVSVAMSGEKPCIKPGFGVNFKDCPDCPEMVLAPSGSFMMGSPENEPDRSATEGPQHKVSIAQPFAIGRFAVTFAEWDACVEGGGCGGYRPRDEGWGRGNRPVINVNLDDAKAYVAWLSKKTGQRYRLLSEAEFEYVARAGTTTPFWWGSSMTPEQANFNPNHVYAGGGSRAVYRAATVPVDNFKPNPWGLYQVHGNVWNWVEDCWRQNYEGASVDGSASIAECKQRVIRGGSWQSDPSLLRAASRVLINLPKGRSSDYGFRVAMTLKP